MKNLRNCQKCKCNKNEDKEDNNATKNNFKWLLQKYDVTIKNDGNYDDNFSLEFYQLGKTIVIDVRNYKDFKQAKREINYLITKKIFNVA